MAHDDSDFDKLLREAREWEARDRSRRKPLKDDDDAGTFPTASPAPTVTIEELRKIAPAEPGPKREPPSKVELANAAAAIKGALQGAMKQAKAQAAADRSKRTKKGGGWLIWALILLYFVIKHFAQR